MKLETREKLLQSAKELFSKKGYYETKVSDIVEKSGVAQGTFYIYFKSKEEIFLELVKSLHLDLMERLEKYIKIEKDCQSLIKDFVKEFLTEVYNNREIAEIFFSQLFGLNQDFKKLYLKKISDIQNLIFRVVNRYFPEEESQILSTLILGFVRQIFFNCLTNKNLSLDQMLSKAEKGIDIIFQGIYSEERKS
ncbi:TetR/AcrR family transcriptional regulator [Sulfurihydrogenibium azorense]|uniref:TetR/AcrR family transcriptional regulator n=1 Tax=Sulfurihydrogenibium azorense TaxID=309806 RepID=UPI002409F74F|nr:TetR/AcrR family transcriptional regulator [Sulfurihydrogenibium azorense]MDM7273560.1 TetR/AcrR family transcriptional regulator [Sulfurihydrogenibium azorense]